MNIADEIFIRKRPLVKEALKYGFRRSDDGNDLIYSEKIMDGDFTCSVAIHPDGKNILVLSSRSTIGSS